MQLKTLDQATTSGLDAALSAYVPFGNCDYIFDQRDICYIRRLEKIGDAVPSAKLLARQVRAAESNVMHKVLGDTVVRSGIQSAFQQVFGGIEDVISLGQCERIFTAALHATQESSVGLLVDQVGRSTTLSPETRIWVGIKSDDPLSTTFLRMVKETYGDAPLCAPTESELAMLEQGARLLQRLLPNVSASALRHTQLVALFPSGRDWKNTASSSSISLSGTVFLDHELLKNPWWVAEHLLHEALHQKLYDFRVGHSLLAKDSEQGTVGQQLDTVQVVAPWNPPGLGDANRWDTHRCLAAFHVYTHLWILCTLAEQSAPMLASSFGPLTGALPLMTSAKAALERAHYLGEHLKDDCWSELGHAGQLMVDWLRSVLCSLDPTPPPHGADIHLLLHRYLTEGRRVERTIRSASDFQKQEANRLLDDELHDLKHVLAVLSNDAELKIDASVLTGDTMHDEERSFYETRQAVVRTLSGASPDGYTLARSGNRSEDLEAAVRNMVERSSRGLAEAGL